MSMIRRLFGPRRLPTRVIRGSSAPLPDRTAAAPSRARFSIGGATMGTRFSAVFHAPTAIETAPIGVALQAAVDLVDDQMSTWKPCSSLSRFNASAPGGWFEIPSELGTVIACGLDLSRRSSGAFDMSVGRIVNLWGFGPDGARASPPAVAEIEALARATVPLALELRDDHRAVRKSGTGALDLSAIAKGYGVDRACRALDAAGITDYLVSIDGEVRCRGTKPGGERWGIAVEQPVPGERRIQRVLSLTDCAAATSGNYRHFHAVDGQRIAHTIDGHGGRPVINRVASVTVLDRDCMVADGLATALLVMGEIAGLAFARSNAIPALFLIEHEGAVEEVTAGAFETLSAAVAAAQG